MLWLLAAGAAIWIIGRRAVFGRWWVVFVSLVVIQSASAQTRYVVIQPGNGAFPRVGGAPTYYAGISNGLLPVPVGAAVSTYRVGGTSKVAMAADGSGKITLSMVPFSYPALQTIGGTVPMDFTISTDGDQGTVTVGGPISETYIFSVASAMFGINPVWLNDGSGNQPDFWLQLVDWDSGGAAPITNPPASAPAPVEDEPPVSASTYLAFGVERALVGISASVDPVASGCAVLDAVFGSRTTWSDKTHGPFHDWLNRNQADGTYNTGGLGTTWFIADEAGLLQFLYDKAWLPAYAMISPFLVWIRPLLNGFLCLVFAWKIVRLGQWMLEVSVEPAPYLDEERGGS